MEYLYLQGRYSNSRYSRSRTQSRSFLVMAIVFVSHMTILLLALNEEVQQSELLPERTLYMINLLPEEKNLTPTPLVPDERQVRPIQLTIPTIQFSEAIESPESVQSDQTSDQTSGQYGNIFNPKMRQKLIDSQGINRPRAHEKSKTWTAIDGRTFIDMGDGNCMVSMSKVDSRDRANNWGYTTCGKNDSEKAMDRVMADFESRRAPVNKLKTH